MINRIKLWWHEIKLAEAKGDLEDMQVYLGQVIRRQNELEELVWLRSGVVQQLKKECGRD